MSRRCCQSARPRWVLVALLVILQALLVPAARAVDAEWILTADVPLVSRAPADQKLALQEAMRRVLVRLSGRATIGTSVPLARAFAEPHLYAKQITAVPIAGGEALRVTFNEAALASLLKSMGLTVWPKLRPQVVAWPAAGSATDARLVGSGPFVTALQTAARARGVPLLVPRLDAIDRAAVTGADVLGRVAEPVVKASARYQGEMVLLGSWREGPGGRGTGDWLLVSAAGSFPYRGAAENAQRHADALAEWIVAVATGRQSLASSLPSGQPMRVQVDGVATLDDYAAAIAALDKLGEVRDIQLTSYVGDTLVLGLLPKSNHSAMLRALSAAPGFSLDLGAGFGTAGQPGLRLRWAPRRAP